MKISSARIDAEGGRLDNATLKTYGETLVGGAAGANSGTAYTVNIANGNVFHIFLNANCTFTFSNPAASGTTSYFTLLLKQDGGARTATWPSTVLWAGGSAPTLSTAGGAYDTVSFMTTDGGTSYLGFAGGLNFATAAPTAYALWAWGLGTNGQLSLGDVANRSVPTQVGKLSTWSSVAAGGAHSLAVKSDATLWADGDNASGQLGLSDVVLRSSPTQVGGFITWSQIANGDLRTLALKTDGTLWSWGTNTDGRLGLGDVVNRSSPVQVGTLATWSAVAGGNILSLAVKTDGTLWSWGSNTYGKLGLGDVVLRSSPVQVGTLATWSAVVAGGDHLLAPKTDGTLWAWGYHSSGGLGLGDIIHRSSPVQVGTLATWSAVAGNKLHSIAIKTDSTLWSWGKNTYGRLGLGDVVSRSPPVQVGGGAAWGGVSKGPRAAHTLALQDPSLLANSQLFSWGSNNYGNLSLGNTAQRSSPVQVGTFATWGIIASGAYLPLAIKSDGSLWTAGR